MLNEFIAEQLDKPFIEAEENGAAKEKLLIVEWLSSLPNNPTVEEICLMLLEDFHKK